MKEDKIIKIFDTITLMANDVVPVSRAKIAACVVYKNRIVSFGVCQMKSHPFQVRFQRNEHSCFLHAEVDAIRKAVYRIGELEMKKTTLLVSRVKTDTKRRNYYYGLAKPCDGCKECIDFYKIKNVYYTEDSNENLIYSKLGTGHIK